MTKRSGFVLAAVAALVALGIFAGPGVARRLSAAWSSREAGEQEADAVTERGGVSWHSNLDAALAAGQTGDRPVLAVFRCER